MGRGRHDRACRTEIHGCDVRDSRGAGLFAQPENTMSEKPIRVDQRKRDASRGRKEVEFGELFAGRLCARTSTEWLEQGGQAARRFLVER
eukprot:5718096-Pleurochrysis_carterae.AAC.2